jgi:dipeptidyl aminopeptidase/acylaminoacyl peptidase
VEGQKPLWRDRAAEMREAGYEPVAGLPPDLWPAAELTLWFVGDDGVIYYEAVKAPELSLLPLAGDVSLVGDIQPTPDGTGVVAVLRTGQGLGVYRLTPDGGSERLLDGEELYQRLMDEHSGEGDYAVELGRARSSGELLRQPRLDESTGTLYVAAGPPGDYEIWTADPETGKVEPFESYNTNLIPCLARGGVLYYQHHSAGPDQPALVYADDPATGDSDFIMTPGNAGGLISFDLGEDGTFAYLAVDYEDTPVVNYQRPDESFSENLKVPGDAPESVAVGPGGVIVVTGAYEGRDNVIFFNLDDLEGDDMPQIRYWTGISDIRSTRLGPPLTAP